MGSYFEIRRRSSKKPISILVDFATVRGKALMRDTADTSNKPAKAALATAIAIGMPTRDVVVGGPSALDRAQVYPGRLELADTVDGMVTLDPLPDAYEAEGDEYVLQSGTGAITSGTSLGAELSYVNGKLRVKQTNDVALYNLVSLPTPEDAGNTRVYVEKIH